MRNNFVYYCLRCKKEMARSNTAIKVDNYCGPCEQRSINKQIKIRKSKFVFARDIDCLERK